MKFFRFSIGRLLAAIALIAVACVALFNASGLWFGVLYSAGWGLLVASVPNIVYRKEQSRAFWLGVLVFGLGYWLLEFRPLTNMDSASGMQGGLPARLFEWLYPFVAHQVPTPGGGFGGGGFFGGSFGGGGFGAPGGGFGGGMASVGDPQYHEFLLVGNALSLLLVAIAGGYWSRFVYWRGKQDLTRAKGVV